MQRFISLTWTRGVDEAEAKVLVSTVSQMLARVAERVGGWFASHALPAIRPFGDWVILMMPQGSAYSSVDWYLERSHAPDGERIDGPAYLRLVEIEPWQSTTPHFDLALVAQELVDANGESVLNVAVPGLAAVASVHQLRKLPGGEGRTLALHHLVAHALGRALGIPFRAPSTAAASLRQGGYCSNRCAMRPCTHLRHLVDYGLAADERAGAFCPVCQRDLEGVLIGSRFSLT